MLIANREGFAAAARRGWKNPAVTDGLVAMFDGIWNVVAGGEHDSTATKWTNLVDGTQRSITAGRFSANGWTVTSSSSNIYFNTGIDVYRRALTIQVAGVFSNTFLDSTSDNLWWRWNYAAKINLWASERPTPKYAKGRTATVGIDLDSAKAGVHIAGNGWKWGTARSSQYGSSGQLLCLGGYGDGVTAGDVWHCLRVYNRLLTDAELAANWEQDKERFGLP